MDGSSNNSFIPKRGTSNRPKRGSSHRVYVITLVTYVLFFATLVATAGVFLYSRYIDTQFQTEVALLSDEIDRFNDADMNRVLLFDERLQKAQDRLDSAVSLGSLFTAIEMATAETVQIDSLRIERNNDEDFELVAAINTDSFDSSIFQREVFEQNSIIESVEIEQLTITPNSLDTTEAAVDLSDSSQVSFTAKLGVLVSAIPFVPQSNSLFEENVPVATTLETEPVDSSEEEEGFSGVNEIELWFPKAFLHKLFWYSSR